MAIPTSLTAANLVFAKVSSTVTGLGAECVLGIPTDDVVGTGKTQVSILQQDTGWSRDNFHSIGHPIAVVNIYADADRDPDTLELLENNAANKALGVYKAIDPLLDYVTPWAGVISCRRASEPEIYPVDDDTYAVMLHVTYELVTP